MMLCLFCFSRLSAQDAFYLSPGSQVKIDTGTIVTVIGNVTLDSGARLSHHGKLYIKNDGASMWYDLNTNGDGLSGTGQVVFQGKSGISYSGFTRFYDLTIDGGPVNFSRPGILNVTNRLLLQKGVINIGSGSALHILNPAFDAVKPHVSNKGYSNSYINGSMTRNINVDSFTYDFPVGNQASVHLLAFINHFITGVDNLTAFFDVKSGSDGGIKINASTYTSINENGVWHLQPQSSATGGSYGLRLHLNGFRGLEDDQFSIVARPLNSSKGEDWMIPLGSIIPEAGVSGRTVASGYTLRDNMSNFNNTQFGIGMTYIILKSTLGDLNATRTNADKVKLDWNTQSESNNRGFYVERRLNNALTFSDLTFVSTRASNGSSKMALNYTLSDRNSYPGTSYYRLRQLDKDGTVAYSNIVTVTGTRPVISFSPNPTRGMLNISAPFQQNYTFIVIDAEGRKVMQLKLAGPAQVQLNKLASGTYTVGLYNAMNIPVLLERIVLLK